MSNSGGLIKFSKKLRRFKPPTSENEETKSESWHDVMVRTEANYFIS